MKNLEIPYEWEMLDEPIELRGQDFHPSKVLTPHPNSVRALRDSNYYLRLEASGEGANPYQTNTTRNLKSGETISGEDLFATTPVGDNVCLHKAIYSGITQELNGKFELKLSCHKISAKRENANEPQTVIQYALNCPDLSWSTSTSKRFDGAIKIEVGGKLSPIEELSHKFSTFSEGHAWDSAVLKNKYGSVCVTKVKSKKADPYRPCSVHFFGNEGIFDQLHRKKWLEAISFFFGKRLIPIGTRHLDNQGHRVTQDAHDPYAHNLANECSNGALPPTSFTDDTQTVDEAVLSKLIEHFIDAYDELELGEVVWNLWFGRMMPLGMNLVGYASALERLMNAWFKSQRSKSHGAYVDPTLFNNLTGELLTELKAKFPGDQNWEKIVRNMGNGNRLSTPDKFGSFLEDLNIESGPVEKEIINARNKFAHGGGVDAESAQYVVKAARAYQTLVYRCILASIGASETYIDYSTYGFPARPISQKMGGALDDLKLFE